MCLVLIPDSSTVRWSIEGVVDTKSDNEQPGKEGKESVGQERALAMALAFGEGVHCGSKC